MLLDARSLAKVELRLTKGAKQHACRESIKTRKARRQVGQAMKGLQQDFTNEHKRDIFPIDFVLTRTIIIALAGWASRATGQRDKATTEAIYFP